jgi:4-amino-4-deoxy-L-arabinose transferase-like glycosyltransferase
MTVATNNGRSVRREWMLVGLLCGVSLILGTTYALAFEDQLVIEGDAASYDENGWRLAQGLGYPTEGFELQPGREPGIYTFLGGVYWIFGHSQRAARLTQVLLVASICALMYLVARRYRDAGYFPAATPIVASALTVAYPAYVFYSGILMREILITFLFLVSLLPLTDYLMTARLKAAVLYGICAGLGGLVDGRLFFFSIFVGMALFAVTLDWRRSSAFLGLTVVTALLVISPWTIRNYLTFDRFVLLSTAESKGLFLVTGPEELLEWDWDSELLRPYRDLPGEERDQALSRKAIENLKENPWPYLSSAPRRLGRLWVGGHSFITPFAARSTAAAIAAGNWAYVAMKAAFVGWNFLYLIGGMAGAVLFARRQGILPILHFVAFVAYLSFVHTALFATLRYQLPAIPALTILLAYFLTSDFTAGLRQRVSRLKTGVAT